MTNRGFTIGEELSQINVQLNTLAFLDGRERIMKAKVKESQFISSVKVHV